MRILDRCVLHSFVIALCTSMLVVTFVVVIGGIFKLSDVIAQGVPARPLLAVFFLTIPQALSFSIPLSTLISSLLVFGRLSGDNEIMAMRCSGLSLPRIAAGPLIFGLLLSGLCLYILNWSVPAGHYKARVILSRLGRSNALRLIETGRFNQGIPGMAIYVGERNGKELHDVRIYDRRPGENRDIVAKFGFATQGPGPGELTLDLRDVRVDPAIEGQKGAAYCRSFPIVLDLSEEAGSYLAKETDLTGPELIKAIHNPREFYPQLTDDDLRLQVSKWKVEFHERLALSLSCLAFALLGVPLGVRTHRKETWIGTAISLALMVGFYLFVIAAESLATKPEFMPHAIVWIPVFGHSALGVWLLRRVA